jgi:FHA domain-containing protein
MLGTVLLAGIVLLMLVVFIPVGVSAFNSMRRKMQDRALERELAAKRTPPPATVKMPAAATPAKEPQKTTFIPLKDIKQEGAGEQAGTAMMQWYGMLHCTSGPLEGQRFVIEEEGLYIGRDPEVAKIVVNDNRISKRHVRIMPRGGKVFAIDEGSTNGTFLGNPGGERLTEHQLKRGDTIILADNAATFVYQI